MWCRKSTSGLIRQFTVQLTQSTSQYSSCIVFIQNQRRYRLSIVTSDNTSVSFNIINSSSDISNSSNNNNNNNNNNTINSGYTWVWNETENWCSLCREPLNSWNEHRGKRDHICLEMFYNALVQYGRQWTPSTLWWEVEECTLLKRPCSALPCPSKETIDDLVDGPYFDYVDGPSAGNDNLSTLMRYYDRAEHYGRRLELFTCVQHLVENGIIRTDRASLSGGASFHGSLVTFKELFPNLVNMFPYADAKEISALTQMIASTYNSETVFDLCNFKMLMPVDQAQETSTGIGKKNIPPPFEEQQQQNSVIPDSATGDYSYHLKGVFCRGVMGQLRWALEPDSVASPLLGVDGNNRGGSFDHYHWHVLAEHTCRALLAEMVFCRISEYVVRVEGVWRQRGQEMARNSALLGGKRDYSSELQRLASNWGMLKYMDNRFYDPYFGNRLPNDGTPKRKRAHGK
ncbi:hypothetical protein LSM04_008946 [Trypanosoma melophagium]|uniref:uncharacterized protein n=1 Tax=Trypanosoma melophagium TaxID=715481 RepID=UPI00351A6D19|nr:hypothetical protein LSM04_008946 [Trypanosoma melophagium]